MSIQDKESVTLSMLNFISPGYKVKTTPKQRYFAKLTIFSASIIGLLGRTEDIGEAGGGEGGEEAVGIMQRMLPIEINGPRSLLVAHLRWVLLRLRGLWLQ